MDKVQLSAVLAKHREVISRCQALHADLKGQLAIVSTDRSKLTSQDEGRAASVVLSAQVQMRAIRNLRTKAVAAGKSLKERALLIAKMVPSVEEETRHVLDSIESSQKEALGTSEERLKEIESMIARIDSQLKKVAEPSK